MANPFLAAWVLLLAATLTEVGAEFKLCVTKGGSASVSGCQGALGSQLGSKGVQLRCLGGVSPKSCFRSVQAREADAVAARGEDSGHSNENFQVIDHLKIT